ncbi:MAG: hypothetical protein HQL48_04685 [Gammaproteobacteria bacterium]|nr:hypothetical protein [Gammaproteobacteria bacterium]
MQLSKHYQHAILPLVVIFSPGVEAFSLSNFSLGYGGEVVKTGSNKTLYAHGPDLALGFALTPTINLNSSYSSRSGDITTSGAKTEYERSDIALGLRYHRPLISWLVEWYVQGSILRNKSSWKDSSGSRDSEDWGHREAVGLRQTLFEKLIDAHVALEHSDYGSHSSDALIAGASLRVGSNSAIGVTYTLTKDGETTSYGFSSRF